MTIAFPEKFVAGVVAHINEDHRREMLDLAHGLAGQNWASEASLLHADKHGLDLLLHAADREERLRVTFDEPLERPNQFRPALIALIQRARQALPDSAATSSRRSIELSDALYNYLHAVSLREPEVLQQLRAETARNPEGRMQVGPEQGQFMALLLQLIGAQRTIEIGVFTGYSTLWTALALPANGRIVACDVNAEWTSIGQRYWAEAGVAHKIDLCLAPAAETLAALLADNQAGQFDFAFIDADKASYDEYYEQCLQLLRPGGLIAIDNVLWGGAVADETQQDADTRALRALNAKLHSDDRIDISMLPVGDGLTLARKRLGA
ncbi:MAG: class I SAM-dependent methyltransferase [Chloroflexales bacterium]|nr:class I SAM-dependent methyltransferase [Chloroflexales bacterium]